MASNIAIAGGGFSGALALVNLIEHASAPLTIEWFEPAPRLAAGVAYGTRDAAHLLNVRAERMGALSGQPDHFFHWLASAAGQSAVAARGLPPVADGEDYVPRLVYADYVQDLLERSIEAARQKNITINIHRELLQEARYDSASGAFHLHGAMGAVRAAKALVLATGNPPPRPFAFANTLGDAYITDVWQESALQRMAAFAAQPAGKLPVVIIGTGLTAVDSVLSLVRRGYAGHITLVSRHGRLPAGHVHGPAYPGWDWVRQPELAPRTALGLLRAIRAEVRRAGAKNYHWQSVIDALRPVTQTLWQQLPSVEKQRIFDRLFTLWNIHRHRMAGSLHDELEALKREGRLTILPAYITDARNHNGALTLTLHDTKRGRKQDIGAALLVNCTGPDYRLEHSANPLLRQLHAAGYIQLGGMGVGLNVTAEGRAVGSAGAPIYPMGTLLLGTRFECTAVPELRDQAYTIAMHLLQGTL